MVFEDIFAQYFLIKCSGNIHQVTGTYVPFSFIAHTHTHPKTETAPWDIKFISYIQDMYIYISCTLYHGVLVYSFGHCTKSQSVSRSPQAVDNTADNLRCAWHSRSCHHPSGACSSLLLSGSKFL